VTKYPVVDAFREAPLCQRRTVSCHKKMLAKSATFDDFCYFSPNPTPEIKLKTERNLSLIALALFGERFCALLRFWVCFAPIWAQ
jgi:hypothetical protein